MAKIINRKQLLSLSDEEIDQFFNDTIFEGIFTHEIKSKYPDKYIGSITNITQNGRRTDIVPRFLNVPKTSKHIPEGRCLFKCRLNIEAYREDPSKYMISVRGGSLSKVESLPAVEGVSFKDSKEQDLFDIWGVDSCEFIGFYYYDRENDVYTVDDIRKVNFDRIPYYPGDSLKRPIRLDFPEQIKGIKLDDYYLFTWKLSHKNRTNPYEIYIDFKNRPRRIDPHWFIDTLFDDRHNDKSKNFGSATSFLDTLSKQLSAKESTFVYELLQNANDYPVEGQLVDVEFHITDNYLLFMHTGDKFNVRNISGICGINEKEKVANKKTIGYKGIGFKTVFLNNHYVYLRTGRYSFRFEEKAKKIRRLEAPWPILPIWTDHKEVDSEVNQVFDKAGKKFQVQIALRPDNKALLHRGSNNYSSLFRGVFSDSNIILFIPNINSVRLVIDGKEEKICYRNNEQWVVGDYTEDIPYELQETINKTLEKGNSRIPEKYINFDRTKVSFACKHNGRIIEPIESATIYCYLPTDASWGFPFLMNSDMVPKGDRNAIEKEVNLIDEDETNFNEELAAIAGTKLYNWIIDLLKSLKYDLGSIFALVPDFKKCKKEHSDYKDFISRFGLEFDDCVDKKPIVPVKGGFAIAKDVILDTTGLSSSGIMTDDEFLKFSELNKLYLPLQIIREDDNFKSFLQRYVGTNSKFTKVQLKKLVSNKDFQEWVKVQDNNNKFLQFLLDQELLVEFSDKKIFLSASGNLFNAANIYYDDIDPYLDDLESFKDKLDYLSPETREFFATNDSWNDAISEITFKKFNCDNFVDDVLLSKTNIDETKTKLKDKNTSIHFYKFLSENVIYTDSYKELPFINDSDKSVDGFTEERIVFLSSEEGHQVCNAEWLSNIDIEFLSPAYSKESIKYFKENFGLKDFSHKFMADHIILHEENDVNYHDSIAEAFEKPDNDISVSKVFILYCFAHKDYFKQSSLKDYALNVYDGNGEAQWVLSEQKKIYFPSNLYDTFSSKEWIMDDWMFVLNEGYDKDVESPEELRKFITKAFGVKNIDNKSFYKDIVKNNIDNILPLISGTEDPDAKRSYDFFHYLDDNFDLIFKEEKDEDKFGEYLIASSMQDEERNDLTLKDTTIYFYDNELEDIVGQEWFPSSLISICNKEYGFSKSLTKLGVLTYDFSSFFKNVIVESIDDINETIESKEASIKFFNFVLEHIDDIPDNQQKELKAVNVYLYGQDDPADESISPKILSEAARELFNMGLVEFSDLDIIDPDYHPEKSHKFWNNLGYGSFTATDFYQWLSDNSSAFSDTLLDETKNIKFWRWAFRNQNMQYKDDLYSLPKLLKDGTIDSSSDKIYLSDEYIEEINIEQFIKEYQQQAKYISPKYIDDPNKVNEWKNFWQGIGVKFELIDFLLNKVIPKLTDHKKEELPALLANNRADLEKQDKELISKLKDLMVKANDGNFYKITDCILIDSDAVEPFPFITLPNQISSTIDAVGRLFEDIIKKNSKQNLVRDITYWRQLKIDRYLDLQDEDETLIQDVHYPFINELASIKNNDTDEFKKLENIKDIKLLNRENVFTIASCLTLGSVYRPYFDFEKSGISSLDYLNDSYQQCTENMLKLFNELEVHNDFGSDDINHLAIRECALYFWNTYLTHSTSATGRKKRVKKMIEDKLLDGIACIPTRDKMRCAADLYYGKETSEYVPHIEDRYNKTPLKSLPDLTLEDGKTLWDLLPFKKSLTFTDALYALPSLPSQKRRIQLVDWMLDEYNEGDETQVQAVEEYRGKKDACWFNTKNQMQPITDLYALDKTLEQSLGTNPRIINKSYLPEAKDKFKKACDMLQIKTITVDDLDMEPVDSSLFTDCIVNNKLYALVIASKIDSGTDWKQRYDDFMEKLTHVAFYKCGQIKITYKEDKDINQSLLKSYFDSETNCFYFVKSLDNKRVFKSYVPTFMEILHVNNKDIAEELVEEIMDSPDSAVNVIREQNEMLLDKEFMAILESLVPSLKGSLSGIEAVVDDMEPPFEEDETIETDYQGNLAEDNPDEADHGVYPNENEKEDVNEGSNTTSSSGDEHDEGHSEQYKEPDDSSPDNNSNRHNEEQEQKPERSNHSDDRSEPEYGEFDNHDDFEDLGDDDGDDDSTPTIKKGKNSSTSKAQQIDAQLEAQRFLIQEMPYWEFPEGYGESDEQGKPIHYSVAYAIDQNGNKIRFVLKSYKKKSEPFMINPNEWDEMMKRKAQLFVYTGSKIVRIEPRDLIKNQSNVTITFSTVNLDIEERISAFADALHFFNELHFDFESFNISARAKSIKDIYNKVSGTQNQTTDDDL